MKVRQFTKKVGSEFPEGYKVNWIAYNEDNTSEKIILDNHYGKSLHWHEDEKQKSFIFEYDPNGSLNKMFIYFIVICKITPQSTNE
ncbi:11769_t:CDS:2, partial [Gigaspora rosea]